MSLFDPEAKQQLAITVSPALAEKLTAGQAIEGESHLSVEG